MNQRVCTSQPKEQFSGVSTQLFQRLRDAFSQFKTQTRHFVHPIIRMLLESQQDEKRQVLSMVTPWVLCVILPASCHPHLGINTLVQSTPGTGDGDLPSCGCRNQKWSQRPRVQVQEELGEERLLSFFLWDQSNTQIRMMVTFICHVPQPFSHSYSETYPGIRFCIFVKTSGALLKACYFFVKSSNFSFPSSWV